MESIFDYGVSPAEMRNILGKAWAREDYESAVSSQNAAYVELWRLFLLRGEPEKARRFFEKIDNRFLKNVLSELDWGIVGI